MEEFMSQPYHPLFSSLISFYIIILILFPNHFIQIALSPVLVSTTILLIFLLRLGSNQNSQTQINSIKTQQPHKNSLPKDCFLVPNEANQEKKLEKTEYKPPFYSFVEWNLKAPLEVIYEEEEEEDELGYPLMCIYCSESDSDESLSEDNFPMTGVCFRWEEEEEEAREGLIEIELNGKINRELFETEEENLIEIDISPTMVSF